MKRKCLSIDRLALAAGLFGILAGAALRAGAETPAQVTVSSSEAMDTARAVADAYGAKSWNQVADLRYTFHVDTGQKKFDRRWDWDVEHNRVTYEGNDPKGNPVKVTYDRSDLDAGDPDLNKAVEKWFINDQYWLIFPLHLAWDDHVHFTLEKDKVFPIPPGSGRRLTVAYGNDVGYTPGDSYDLYLNPDNHVVQWVYHKAGAPTPTVMTTWEKNTQVGPLLISLERKTEDHRLRLWFSDVSTRLKQ